MVDNKKLVDVFKDTELSDFEYEGFDNAEDLIESLNTQIDETEVIYYGNAIKYLADNDASLKESLALADELGYTCKDLNSEKLATLLQQQNLRDELSKLTSEIEEAFND